MSNIFEEIKKIRWTEPKVLLKTSAITICVIFATAAVFIGYDFILSKLIQLIYS